MMNKIILPLIVLIPIVFGLFLPLLPLKSQKAKNIYVEAVVIFTSILAIMMLMNRPSESFTLFRLTKYLGVSFFIDDLGAVFVGILALLWPFATLYAFEYMEHEDHKDTFFMFYTITYGVTLGIALSRDILSMYVFYELLTMVTLPLIIHTLSKEAIHATRKYLYYSLGGAAFAFIGVIFILVYGNSVNFTLGGVLDLTSLADQKHLLVIIYFLCFLGFSVKTAMFPFSEWLPTAGVAPTPVTALLHAVAVVKAGAFACMRITYYSFGPDLVKGSWAQMILLALVVFTIVYGCARALKETHIKRRLAWSTVSNLSYILFGVLLMTPLGLIGALAHMCFHAVMKITSFLCAGAIMHKSHKNYIHELNGMARKMPMTFITFTVSGLALMGVPGMCGFISKFHLASAALDEGSTLALIGVVALLISALLTAIYMMTIAVRAFFPGKDFDYLKLEGIEDPSWKMLVPFAVFMCAMVYFGINSTSLVDFFTQIASGL